ncbi:hypothetical protein SCG7086_AN_00190 [Chlamydiales bacterium SCGC AG-110-P3]|nr:hypothetical protein SCG7086_AN_00190 [Chlamydiales bacterium SCGC AG-110-P3]
MSLLNLLFEEEFSEDSEDFKAVVADASKDVEEKDKPAVKAMLKDVFTSNKKIGDILGISEAREARLYVDACKMYESGQYPQAESLFTLLYGFRPSSDKYLFALAASIHRQERYDEAMMYYFMYPSVKPEDPKGYYHAADCLRNLNRNEAAFESLGTALLYTHGRPEYEKLGDTIQEEMAALEAIIEKENSSKTSKKVNKKDSNKTD